MLENAEKEGKPVVERRILPEDVKDFEECFVTNSLMGIMPVTALGEVENARFYDGLEVPLKVET